MAIAPMRSGFQGWVLVKGRCSIWWLNVYRLQTLLKRTYSELWDTAHRCVFSNRTTVGQKRDFCVLTAAEGTRATDSAFARIRGFSIVSAEKPPRRGRRRFGMGLSMHRSLQKRAPTGGQQTD